MATFPLIFVDTAQFTCSLLEAGMALPAEVLALLYGEEEIDRDECDSSLRWG